MSQDVDVGSPGTYDREGVAFFKYDLNSSTRGAQVSTIHDAPNTIRFQRLLPGGLLGILGANLTPADGSLVGWKRPNKIANW